MKSPTDIRWQRTPIRGEAKFIPQTIGDLEQLRSKLVTAGHPSQVVNGLTGWLVAKALGEKDTTSGPTRANYRRILAELDASDSDPVRSLAA